MKRDILIWFLFLFVLLLILLQIGPLWKKHATIDVDGKITSLYDLCDYAYRENVELFDEDDPILEVYLGEITGMDAETWQSLEIEKEAPVYIFDSNLSA